MRQVTEEEKEKMQQTKACSCQKNSTDATATLAPATKPFSHIFHFISIHFIAFRLVLFCSVQMPVEMACRQKPRAAFKYVGKTQEELITNCQFSMIKHQV